MDMTMTPHGATEPRARNNSGWRSASDLLDSADRLAGQGASSDVSKSAALIAVKRVGAQIGLKPADLMLLDTLCAFSQPQDWEAARRPIVWPSNALLEEQTGLSRSALKRRTRRLAEAGLITFADSPNGKRWGRRGAGGYIIEAYGFDLSPLAARAGEFTALHAQIVEDRALCARLKRQITIARRTIRARLERTPCAELLGRLSAVLETMPRAKATAKRLEHVLDSLQDILAALTEIPAKPDPKGPENEPHIQTTNQLPKVEKGQGPQTPMELGHVLTACPEFAFWVQSLGHHVRHWADLTRLAGEIKGFIGITDRAWASALRDMGDRAATIALALIFDKHARNEVRSCTGYLRGMAAKARAGALHLDRSIHGRLSAQAGAACV
ncbi:MAG: plasmid replication protein RepC [Pseudomonadota bacterium]